MHFMPSPAQPLKAKKARLDHQQSLGGLNKMHFSEYLLLIPYKVAIRPSKHWRSDRKKLEEGGAVIKMGVALVS